MYYDVVILLITFVWQHLFLCKGNKVIARMTSKSEVKCYNITEIVDDFGEDICKALPFFSHLQAVTQFSASMGKENVRFGIYV